MHEEISPGKLDDVLPINKKTGMEPILDTYGNTITTVQKYWQWAYSSFSGNIERGHFAEFLVANALGIADGTRVEWDSYDLKTHEGTTIEIKASGYIQNWGKKSFLNHNFQ